MLAQYYIHRRKMEIFSKQFLMLIIMYVCLKSYHVPSFCGTCQSSPLESEIVMTRTAVTTFARHLS